MYRWRTYDYRNLLSEDQRVKKLTDLSLKLEGLNRNVATHAAGVVIADKKLTEVVPLYKDASADLYYYHQLNLICTQQKMLV